LRLEFGSELRLSWRLFLCFQFGFCGFDCFSEHDVSLRSSCSLLLVGDDIDDFRFFAGEVNGYDWHVLVSICCFFDVEEIQILFHEVRCDESNDCADEDAKGDVKVDV